LIELQVVVAQAARDGRASGKILVDERAHHIALEAVFVIHHVVGNAEILGNAARVVDVINRAAAALRRDLRGHTAPTTQAALVPELHGQTNHSVPLGAEYGRDGGRIHTARHGYRDGLGWHWLCLVSIIAVEGGWLLAVGPWLLAKPELSDRLPSAQIRGKV